MKCNCQTNEISPTYGHSSMPLMPCHGGDNNFTHYMQLIAANHALVFQVKKLEKKLAELEAKEEEEEEEEEKEEENDDESTINCETVEKLLKEEQEKSTKFATELDELKAKMKNFSPDFA